MRPRRPGLARPVSPAGLAVLIQPFSQTEGFMRSTRFKGAVALVLLVLLLTTPLASAQAPSVVNVFSIWVRLSLRGNSQQEIESQLSNMDPKTLAEVKSRLRQSVISNLRIKRIGERYETSQDSDDRKAVLESIQTEIRFAGLENDEQLVLMIKDRFGIHMRQF